MIEIDPVSPRPLPRTLIVGCGGHGRVVLDILTQAGGHQVIGFVDSDPRWSGRLVDGLPVLGCPDDLEAIRFRYDVNRVIVAIGDNGVRRSMARRLESLNFELINAIHPSSNLARNALIGSNVVIAAGALVCAHCSIGDSVILNTGCIVDHETLIGPATHVCPGAKLAGRVTVESGAFIGIGATVIQGIHIGSESVIGAGAVVIDNVVAATTVVGVPARPIRDEGATTEPWSWLVPEGTPVHSALNRPSHLPLPLVPSGSHS